VDKREGDTAARDYPLSFSVASSRTASVGILGGVYAPQARRRSEAAGEQISSPPRAWSCGTRILTLQSEGSGELTRDTISTLAYRPERTIFDASEIRVELMGAHFRPADVHQRSLLSYKALCCIPSRVHDSGCWKAQWTTRTNGRGRRHYRRPTMITMR
jgi:hypothetical protein